MFSLMMPPARRSIAATNSGLCPSNVSASFVLVNLDPDGGLTHRDSSDNLPDELILF